MYLPKHFECPDPALTLEIMRTHNFATLTSVDADGAPFVTHLPVALTQATEEGDKVVLHFHMAKANPHCAMLREKRASMFAFLGPHAYMSPSVYADLRRVPTWNYIAVHAYGQPQELAENDAKDALLKSLIAIHEPAYADQWRALDEKYQTMMMSAICAFRMTVTKLESKFKLNQHRPEARAAMKAKYGEGKGTADEQALIEWLTRITPA